MKAMVDAFAQYERALIRARTRAALASKRARCEAIGTPPLGYRLARDRLHIEPDPAERLAIERVITLRREGLSIRAIAAALDRERVPCRGARWHRQSVWRVLQAAAGEIQATAG